MKIKGTRGPPNIPRIRITGGVYFRQQANDTVTVASRPIQPYLTDDNAKYNRDLMAYSAWLINLAIPIEVQSALNWQVNSNDTWKDALTRAQFGTLMRIIGPNGENYHPADHSFQGQPQEPAGMSAFTSLGEYRVAVSGAVPNFDVAIPSGITELICIVHRISGTVLSELVCRVSTDGGATFKAGATDYQQWPATGVPANKSSISVTGQNNANFQSGLLWFPAIHIGGAVVGIAQPYGGASGIYVGSTSAINGLRFLRTAGNISGDTPAFIAVLGR